MENDKFWLAFASIEKISSKFTISLYDYFGDIKKAWNSTYNDLINIDGIKSNQIETFLSFRDKTNPDKCLNYIYEKNIKFFHLESEEYPFLLKQIPNPPACVLYLGDLNRCNFNKTLAIVGSRKVTYSAKKTLKRLIQRFANTDLCVVSGLAIGADTEAHKNAIENNLSTIAVLGGGFDFLYPQENKNLFSSIVQDHGVVMTEYWPTFAPISWRFPSRNRIVAALSFGTVVLEAKLKSGALITANLCLDYCRELMCVPGDLNNPNTEGIYHLLKNGATMVTDAEDIMETMKWTFSSKQYKKEDLPELNEFEKKVFDIIRLEEADFDLISQKAGLTVDETMLHLTTLELKGLIKQTEGSRYIVI